MPLQTDKLGLDVVLHELKQRHVEAFAVAIKTAFELPLAKYHDFHDHQCGERGPSLWVGGECEESLHDPGSIEHSGHIPTALSSTRRAR